MAQWQERLANRFLAQAKFAADYSPLYARLFGVTGAWLNDPGVQDDPLAVWLLQTSQGRRSLDVTLLLAAGLHNDILAGHPAVTGLAEYYPTAGGSKLFSDRCFPLDLRQAILDRRDKLAAYIQKSTVKTNETAGACQPGRMIAFGGDHCPGHPEWLCVTR